MESVNTPEDRVHLLDEVIETILDAGDWEILDTWGNGTLSLTDDEQFNAAEKLADMIADIWDSVYAQGVSDGRVSDASIDTTRKCECKVLPTRDNPYRRRK